MENKVLAMVMAGGRGERLYPLTLERSKPSVPFGGKYRIIDFVLSNLINSGIYSIYVLVQYKSQSLIEHIRRNWRREGVSGEHFITVVPPQMRRDDVTDWYRGTADSIYQNINLILDFSPKLVAIFSGDHIYRMDLREMINFHLEKDADLSISALPLKKYFLGSFGLALVDKNLRVKKFIEKPAKISPELKKSNLYLSMGNYIFKPSVLSKILEEDSRARSSHDFGKDIIPKIIKDYKVFVYDFSKNKIPGIRDYEEEAYWRDVGTIKSFFEANMDLLGKRPLLDLSNNFWPIYGGSTENLPPSKIDNTEVFNSLISEGSVIKNSQIKNSVIGRGVVIEEGCQISNSIIMDFTKIGARCRIKKVIIDRFNIIKKNTLIGFNLAEDRNNYFVKDGIVILKRGPRRSFS